MHPPLPFAPALDGILAALCDLVWGRFGLFGDRAMPLLARLNHARQRLARLLAHLAAGRLPHPRAPRPCRRGGPRAVHLPRGRAWLVARLGYRAAGLASQLRHLLDQPGVAETLAASPGAVRTLRPLCRMLGVALPERLRPPPPPEPPAAAPPRGPVPNPPAPPLRRELSVPELDVQIEPDVRIRDRRSGSPTCAEIVTFSE